MLRLVTGEGGVLSTSRRAGNAPADPSRVIAAAPGRPGLPRSTARAIVVADRAGTLAAERLASERRARMSVAAENHAASAQEFDPTDPRWVLAVRTAGAIEGGRAAVLPPEARARLLGLATRLGLRPFDAHLVMAIVQDAARCGREVVADDTRGRLALVQRPRDITRGETAVGIGLRLAASALIAVGIVGVVVGWIRG